MMNASPDPRSDLALRTPDSRAAKVGVVFMTTRWSRVLLAGDETAADAQAALESLCRDYWRPLYHFARRKGHSPEDAQDLTQGFLARLLEKKELANADRQRGRFRTFLSSAFCHYMANEQRQARTLKRGGGFALVPLEDEADVAREARDDLTPEHAYERTWALAMLERVMDRLREEYEQAGRCELFVSLQPHLSGAGARTGYAQLGVSLGLSESAVAVAVHRMRRRYGELLREEIAATVASPAEVEDELRHLLRVVAGTGGA
jgi:RNA polymerase sigma factor (sigma-70 family)